MGFLEFHPQIKGAHSVLGSSDIPAEQSLLFGPHVRPQARTHLLWAGRPKRAQRDQAVEVPFLGSPHPGLPHGTAPGAVHSLPACGGPDFTDDIKPHVSL